jgi:O-antigen ligase
LYRPTIGVDRVSERVSKADRIFNLKAQTDEGSQPMKERLRAGVVPGYILLCLVLGGSAQGIWANMVLQLLAIAVIAWSLFAKPPGRVSKSARPLFVIAGLMALLIIAQLIPLPPGLWSRLPGRSQIMDSFVLLDLPQPWLPISLTPYGTIATAMTLLPPIAVLMGMLVARAYRTSWICFAILIGTLAAVLLGALQVAGPPSAASPWYLYDHTNFGVATGFFANSNHMAALILVSIPFFIGVIADLRAKARNSGTVVPIGLLTITGVVVLLVSILLNGSFAVLLLGPPVLLTSSLMLMPTRLRIRLPLITIVLISLVGAVGLTLSSFEDRVAVANQASFEGRWAIWSNTIPAIEENWATGTGISSFRKIYGRYEDHSEVDRTVTNHAHNDYLEIVLETGVAGIILLIGFFIFWGGRALAAWGSTPADRYAQAAAIASAAMLVHSLVDYPMRTAALSAVMAACLAMMATRQKPARHRATSSDWDDI